MEKREQKWVCIAVALFLCFPSLNSALGSVTRLLLGGQTKMSTYAIYMIYFFVMLYVLYKAGRKITVGTLGITIFMAVSLGISIVANPIRQYVWTSFGDIAANPMYLFLFYGFWGVILAQYIRDMELLCFWLDRFTLATVALALAQYLIALGNNQSPQYMVFSYNLLFPAAYLSLRCITNYRLTRLIGMAVGAGLILIAGCRGALVCYLSAILFFIVFSGGISRTRKAIIIFVMLVAIVLINIYWDEVLDALVGLLDSVGVDSRTLTKLSTQSFFDDSGRSAIQEIVIDNIGLLPKGLYYDRIVADGSYAHNLFLELLLEYGILLGGVIIVWYCFHMVKSVFAVRGNPTASVVFYSLLACGFLRLMFSGSYLLNEPGFWLLLGMMRNPYAFGARKEQ